MMKSISQTSIGPIQILPDEMLNECLSLLPPSSIAHSSAINKTWRQFIYSHSNLHNEADLSHLGFAYYKSWKKKHKGSGENDLENLLNTFDRISITPTLNHLTRVSINLSILWEVFLSELYEDNKPTKYFAGTMYGCGESLKEISFFLDRYHHDSEDPLAFLLPLIKELDHFDPQYFHSLKSVWIQAPVYVSFKAGGGQSSKSFVLVPTKPMCPGTWEEPEINMVKMIDFATTFVRNEGGLTDFRIQAHDKTEFNLHSMNEIVQVLKNSIGTLQNLHCGLFNSATFSDVWDLASSCPQLVSFFSPYEYVGRVELPERPNSNLKALGFLCHVGKVDWFMLKGWIGGSLEKLDLLAESNGEDISFSLHSPISIIFDSRETLKVLELRIIPFKAPVQELQALASFPKLESLYLDVGMEMTEWFCKLDLPRLHVLAFRTLNFDLYEGKKGKTATSSLVSFLDKHSSKLTELTFKTSQYTHPNFFSGQVPQLSFFKLMHLDLSECFKSQESWFSSFLYPNLVSFSKSQDSTFSPQVFQDEIMESQVEWKQKEGSELWEKKARDTI